MRRPYHGISVVLLVTPETYITNICYLCLVTRTLQALDLYGKG